MSNDEKTETEKHCGVGKEYDFNGEKLIVEPLGVMYFGDSLKVINNLQSKFKGKTPSGEDVFEALSSDEDLMDSMSRMVAATLEKVIGDRTDGEINQFAMQNMIYLFNAVIEQNSPRMNTSDKNKVNKILERQRLHDESVTKNKKSK